ncbi:ATP synthase F0 subunit B [uncultured Desulfovibrio sp.]|uniref:ATP synthase F0 subunit B n=1 Tax=uncultured Desulfovibrio sp. TaxID=167968 RepID=UPI002634FEBC|nr:ATP synthase F0 subunit B [uncultured Desulfovibrio sp.]
MLDLNITLVFQLVNFFIAIFVLNTLLIRPIRTIIKKRNGVMDNLVGEADNFESQAAEHLANYEAELARARQDASLTREEGRNAGLMEQQDIVGTAQKSAREILADTRRSLREQAEATLSELRNQVNDFSTRLADRLIKN